MTEIKLLNEIDLDELFKAFSEAFVDYDAPSLDKNSLLAMLKRRGFGADISMGAFVDGKLVSFTFNGLGSWNHVKTAYDTGTGTIKKYRGKGLAKQIFIESVPILVKNGIKQYLLEVLQHNSKAVPLYNKLGFEVSREFNYHFLPTEKLKLKTKNTTVSFELRKMDQLSIEKMQSFWDFVPSWQNSFDAINREFNNFIFIGAYRNKELIGYGVLEPNTGDITQLAVDKSQRRQGIASSIFEELIAHNQYHSIKIINTEKNCETINAFLAEHKIPISGSQFEMIKNL